MDQSFVRHRMPSVPLTESLNPAPLHNFTSVLRFARVVANIFNCTYVLLVHPPVREPTPKEYETDEGYYIPIN